MLLSSELLDSQACASDSCVYTPDLNPVAQPAEEDSFDSYLAG